MSGGVYGAADVTERYGLSRYSRRHAVQVIPRVPFPLLLHSSPPLAEKSRRMGGPRISPRQGRSRRRRRFSTFVRPCEITRKRNAQKSIYLSISIDLHRPRASLYSYINARARSLIKAEPLVSHLNSSRSENFISGRALGRAAPAWSRKNLRK